MSPRLEISIPPPALRVNGRMGRSWASVRKAKLAYEETVGIELLTQEAEWKGIENHYPLSLRVTIYVRPGPVTDTFDVLSFTKSAWDTFVTMGVWPGDSDAYVDDIHVKVKRNKVQRVVVEWDNPVMKVKP